MKDIDKNSLNKRKNEGSDTLLYIFLSLLLALIIGGIGWWVYDTYYKGNSTPEANIDFIKEIGEKKEIPSAEDVSDLISYIRERTKTAKWVLEDKIRSRKLTDAEKEEVRTKLNSINQELEKFLKGIDIKKWKKDSPELLQKFYKWLYEWGEEAVRLKYKTESKQTANELEEQWNFQKGWDISATEEAEIKEKMNAWMIGWYNQTMVKVLPDKGYTKLQEYIRPKIYQGQEVENMEVFPEEIAASFRKPWRFKDNTILDLSKPLTIEFKGYGGFLNEEDFKNTGEGKTLMGVTKPLSNVTVIIPNPQGINEAFTEPENCRRMEIKLKKELFFNRLGYENWLNSFKRVGETGYKSSSSDICFEQVVDTIVHELAHAVVQSIRSRYLGEEGGGHGQLFYEMMEAIEPVIRETPEFTEFEKWWKL